MNDKEMNIVINWLMGNAYGAIKDDYWVLSDFPANKVPDRFQIPIAPNTKIWRQIRERLRSCESQQ